METYQSLPVEAQLHTWLAVGAYHASLTLLVETYRAPLMRYCLSLCRGQRALAEESTQQVFEAACRGIAQFRAEASAKTWLFAIARREVLHALARQRRAGLLAAQWHQQCHRPVPPARSAPPEDHMATQEVARLRTVLTHAAFTPSDRAILMLRFGLEVPQALAVPEIATVLGLSRATVYRRLTHLLAQLRRLMDQELPVPGRCAHRGSMPRGIAS